MSITVLYKSGSYGTQDLAILSIKFKELHIRYLSQDTSAW